MKRNGQIFALLASSLAFTLPPSAHAQGERSNRIDPHPVRQQVGILSRVLERNAWVAFARPVKVGANVLISAFSDGGDTLFVGAVNWSSASAPYESYVTNIHSVTTKHDLNEFYDYYSLGSLTKQKRDYGSRPETIGDGVFVSAGFYVRADLSDTQNPSEDSIEPVRSNIAALRAQKTKLADVIANAAEKSLGVDPLIAADEQIAEYAVNYSALAGNLRVFGQLKVPDPITEKLLNRLRDLAANSGQVGASVPNNFFRPPSELSVSGSAATTSGGAVRP